MLKQKKLFKQLRRKGLTIEHTKKGHYKIKFNNSTYILTDGLDHSKEYHKWMVRELFKKLKLKY
tara:strand:+ start:429 stop:620 length:192 start_codon:yes stop_codon:yes gene_type:complete